MNFQVENPPSNILFSTLSLLIPNCMSGITNCLLKYENSKYFLDQKCCTQRLKFEVYIKKIVFSTLFLLIPNSMFGITNCLLKYANSKHFLDQKRCTWHLKFDMYTKIIVFGCLDMLLFFGG